jgi:hypothetical protein
LPPGCFLAASTAAASVAGLWKAKSCMASS